MKINPQIKNNRWPSLRVLVGLILTVVILFYGFYEAHDLIAGPVLVIESPLDGEIFDESLISINGKTKRIAKIFINDNQTFTQDDGSFSEPLLLGAGYNIIKVSVHDQFGRQVVKIINLVLR